MNKHVLCFNLKNLGMEGLRNLIFSGWNKTNYRLLPVHT